MISEENLQKAENKLDDIRPRWREVNNEANPGTGGEIDPITSPATFVDKCRLITELSAKSIYLLAIGESPNRHLIDFDGENEGETQDVLNCLGAELGGWQKKNAARVFAISSIWAGPYPHTQHGIHDVPTEDLFKQTDAQYAYEHAREAKQVAGQLVDSTRQELHNRSE